MAGVGPAADAEAVQQGDDRVFDLQVRDAGADRVDRAGDVPTDAERKSLSEHRRERAGAQGCVGRVEGGAGDLDADLSSGRLGCLLFGDLQNLRAAVSIDDDAAHRVRSFLSGSDRATVRIATLQWKVGTLGCVRNTREREWQPRQRRGAARSPARSTTRSSPPAPAGNCWTGCPTNG